jgi:hypothetical protein
MKTLLAVMVGGLIPALVYGQATVAGKWETGEPAARDRTAMELKVNGKSLSGTVMVCGGSFPIEDGKVVDKNTVSFAWTTACPPEGRQIHRSATGKLNGDQLTLTNKGLIVDQNQPFDDSMTLKREK